jgi:hypothetical protein
VAARVSGSEKNLGSDYHVRGMEWIAVQWDDCIAPWMVHYIGGRDPPRVGGQGGGGQGRRHLGEATPPETLMGCLPCNPNGPAARGGSNPNGPATPL